MEAGLMTVSVTGMVAEFVAPAAVIVTLPTYVPAESPVESGRIDTKPVLVPDDGETFSHPPPFDVEGVTCQFSAICPALLIDTFWAAGLGPPATLWNASGVVSTTKEGGDAACTFSVTGIETEGGWAPGALITIEVE